MGLWASTRSLVTSIFSSGNATGSFDALDPLATVDLHLSELNVGRGTTRR